MIDVHDHYCPDVLAGFVVGVIYGLLAFLIVEKLVWPIYEKLAERFKDRKKA